MTTPASEWKDVYLESALKLLYQRDEHLIDSGKERAAAASLACHLRDVLKEDGYLSRFSDLRINVDYGREGDGVKRDLEGTQVVPDIIVHVPGQAGPNVVVVEIKCWWSTKGTERDEKKLQGYKDNQGYAVAYLVFLDKKSPILKRV